jgi:hypothetical protein
MMFERKTFSIVDSSRNSALRFQFFPLPRPPFCAFSSSQHIQDAVMLPSTRLLFFLFVSFPPREKPRGSTLYYFFSSSSPSFVIIFASTSADGESGMDLHRYDRKQLRLSPRLMGKVRPRSKALSEARAHLIFLEYRFLPGAGNY